MNWINYYSEQFSKDFRAITPNQNNRHRVNFTLGNKFDKPICQCEVISMDWEALSAKNLIACLYTLSMQSIFDRVVFEKMEEKYDEYHRLTRHVVIGNCGIDRKNPFNVFYDPMISRYVVRSRRDLRRSETDNGELKIDFRDVEKIDFYKKIAYSFLNYKKVQLKSARTINRDLPKHLEIIGILRNDEGLEANVYGKLFKEIVKEI